MVEKLRTPARNPAQPSVAIDPRPGTEDINSGIPENSPGQTAVRTTHRVAQAPNHIRRPPKSTGQWPAVGHARHSIRRHAPHHQEEKGTRQKGKFSASFAYLSYLSLNYYALSIPCGLVQL